MCSFGHNIRKSCLLFVQDDSLTVSGGDVFGRQRLGFLRLHSPRKQILNETNAIIFAHMFHINSVIGFSLYLFAFNKWMKSSDCLTSNGRWEIALQESLINFSLFEPLLGQFVFQSVKTSVKITWPLPPRESYSWLQWSIFQTFAANYY